MGQKVIYTCDVCGEPIEEGHQQLFMSTVRISGKVHVDDGSAAGTEAYDDTFHVHNDLSNCCIFKIRQLLHSVGKQ